MRKGIVSVLLLFFAVPALASGTQDVLRDTAAMAAREQARAITSVTERRGETATPADGSSQSDANAQAKPAPGAASSPKVESAATLRESSPR